MERPVRTLADGLACRVPARLALETLWTYVADALAVPDDLLLAGVRTLAEAAHVLVEPAGAAAVAGAWVRRRDLAGKRLVLVLSGANITSAQLEAALRTVPLISV